MTSLLTTGALGQIPTSTEFRTTELAIQSQHQVDLAASPDGTFLVVWRDEGFAPPLSGGSIQVRRFSANTVALGSEFSVDDPALTDVRDPEIDVAPDGSFVVVWGETYQEDLETFHSIRHRPYDSAGNPLASRFVTDNDSQSKRDPRVAVGSSGSFVVTWEGQDPQIGIRRFAQDGSPIGSEFSPTSEIYADIDGTAVSVSPVDESFVVLWSGEKMTGADGLWGRRFNSAGSPLGGQFTINLSHDRDHVDDVAHADDGSFIALWTVFRGNGLFLDPMAQRFASDGTEVGAPLELNEELAGTQREPSIAFDEGNRFTVLWTDNDGIGRGIFGRRFDSDGTRMGVEFQVNTYTTSLQIGPVVAHVAPGEFVVAWESYGQDGDQYGVTARTFCGYTTDLDSDLDTVADNCDVCAGFDDTADADGDRIPDGCDPCFGIGPDSDGDGLCDSIYFDTFESGLLSGWSDSND